jgi:predicted ATPase/DNA-binding SARP family transcriptional activator
VIKLLGLTPGHRLHREQVMERLWPEQPADTAANNFYQALHIARRALEPLLPVPETSRWLRLQDEILLLDPPGGLSVDVAAFEAAAATALKGSDTRRLEQAQRLYTGELLPDDRYEDWTSARREALHQLHRSLLLALATQRERAGDFPQAIRTLQQVLASEPGHEEAHVGLMRLHALAGQRHDALQQFERLRENLRRDLDVEPGPASIALFEEILAGQIAADKQAPHGVERRYRSRPATQPSLRKRAKVPARGAPPTTLGNLPVPLTSFIGRVRELDELKQLLNSARLLTITGPGGGGKTRLALALAEAVRSDFRDGAWWVDLSPLADPTIVVSAVASRLNVREQPGRGVLETLAEQARMMNALIILDTCEHLLEACGRLVDALLGAGPALRILTTSREPLGVQGEQIWRVPLMSLPAAAPPSVADGLQSEAVQLFAARARSAHAGFELAAGSVGTVADICRRLDGMPLAIELAAARVRHLTVAEVLKRLDDRFRFLVGFRTGVDRHRTLRAAFDWSYELLGDVERAVFNRLSVFVGGFTLEAAQAVCATHGSEASDILEVLSRLVDRSMVVIEETPDDSIRYRLLDTLRQYGEEQLRSWPDEVVATRAKHRDFFLNFAERGWAEAFGPKQIRWNDRFEREHDNLRAAFDWSMEQGDADAALRLAGATSWFWQGLGHWHEGRARLEAALAADGNISTLARARALGEAGRLAWHQADAARATALLEESLALFRTLGDNQGTCRVLYILGLLAGSHGDLVRAAALYQESLRVAQELGDSTLIAWRCSNLALITYHLGDYQRSAAFAQDCIARSDADTPARPNALRLEAEQAHRAGDYGPARALHEKALAACRQIGDPVTGVAWSLTDLGDLAREQGEYERATACYSEALLLSRRLGAPHVSTCLHGLGTVARDLGDFGKAAALYEESHAFGRRLGYRRRIANSLYYLGVLARYMGNLERAGQLLEESLGLRRAMGNVVGVALSLQALGVVASDGGHYERATELLRESFRLLAGGAGKLTLVQHLEALAAVASGRGDLAQAVRLLACAGADREVMGTPVPPCDRAAHHQTLIIARLGEEAFKAARAAGRAMTVGRAAEEALGDRS